MDSDSCTSWTSAFSLRASFTASSIKIATSIALFKSDLFSASSFCWVATDERPHTKRSFKAWFKKFSKLIHRYSLCSHCVLWYTDSQFPVIPGFFDKIWIVRRFPKVVVLNVWQSSFSTLRKFFLLAYSGAYKLRMCPYIFCLPTVNNTDFSLLASSILLTV